MTTEALYDIYTVGDATLVVNAGTPEAQIDADLDEYCAVCVPVKQGVAWRDIPCWDLEVDVSEEIVGDAIFHVPAGWDEVAGPWDEEVYNLPHDLIRKAIDDGRVM